MTTPTKEQVRKIGQSAYCLIRKFTGKEPLDKILKRLILEQK